MSHILPLQGVRVLEFVHTVMGPACGLVLADLGAEVIKVEEPPDGDRTRHLLGTGAGFWACFNRNKKSFAADLKDPAGLAAVQRLLKTADVMIENYRPGAMEQRGLGYEAVRGLRPDIIYCSLKGFLPGPYEDRPALDEVVQMMGGLAYMTGPIGRPLRAGASVNDIMGGVFGVVAILAALRERGRTGEGQFVQSGLFENNVFLVSQHMLQGLVTGQPPAPMPSRVSAWSIYETLETADNERVFLAVVSDAQWQKFCAAFDLPQLASDPSLATNNQRVRARDRMMPIVIARIRSLTKAQVLEICERANLAYAPIARPTDLFDDPHLLASGGFAELTLEDERKARVPLLPFRMAGRRFGARLDLPPVGSHTADLLVELGFRPEEIEALATSGAIGKTEKR